MVPRLAAGVGQIENRRRWTLRGLFLVSDVLIKKRNSGRNSLHHGWLSVGKHPDITKPIIFRIAVGQSVSQDADQRNFRRGQAVTPHSDSDPENDRLCYVWMLT